MDEGTIIGSICFIAVIICFVGMAYIATKKPSKTHK